VDRFGRKRLLLAGVLVYGVAGTSGFYLRTLWALLAGRAVVGMAVSVVYTATTALIADYYQGQERANFLGLQSAFMASSGVIYTFLGGFLADLGWPVTFLIYALAFLIFPLVWFFLREPALIKDPPLSSQNQRRLVQAVPLLMLGLVYGLTHLGQIIFYTIPVQMPFYLQRFQIDSASIRGLIIGFNSLMMGIAGLSYSKLKKHLSYLSVISVTFGVITAGYLVLGLAQNLTVLLIGLGFSGLGLGLINPNLTTWLVSKTPGWLRGRALGTRFTFLFLGQFLSPLVAQPLIQQGGVPLAYLGAAGLGGILFLFTLMIRIVRREWE
jgi:MFS family permease